MSRWFVAGRKDSWLGRCEVIDPGHFIHHMFWPALQTHPTAFIASTTLPRLISEGYWREIALDPDLVLPEGI